MKFHNFLKVLWFMMNYAEYHVIYYDIIRQQQKWSDLILDDPIKGLTTLVSVMQFKGTPRKDNDNIYLHGI